MNLKEGAPENTVNPVERLFIAVHSKDLDSLVEAFREMVRQLGSDSNLEQFNRDLEREYSGKSKCLKKFIEDLEGYKGKGYVWVHGGISLPIEKGTMRLRLSVEDNIIVLCRQRDSLSDSSEEAQTEAFKKWKSTHGKRIRCPYSKEAPETASGGPGVHPKVARLRRFFRDLLLRS